MLKATCHRQLARETAILYIVPLKYTEYGFGYFLIRPPIYRIFFLLKGAISVSASLAN